MKADMITDRIPPFDVIYVKMDKPGVLTFPSCEVMINGKYDSTEEPNIVFKEGAGKKMKYTKEEFVAWLGVKLSDWGKLQDFIIHPEGKLPSEEIKEFWKIHNS